MLRSYHSITINKKHKEASAIRGFFNYKICWIDKTRKEGVAISSPSRPSPRQLSRHNAGSVCHGAGFGTTAVYIASQSGPPPQANAKPAFQRSCIAAPLIDTLASSNAGLSSSLTRKCYKRHPLLLILFQSQFLKFAHYDTTSLTQ